MTVKTSQHCETHSFIVDYQNRINSQLEHYLPDADAMPATLHQAMRYSVLNGGKRIRALLVYATGDCFAMAASALDIPAVCVELIHSYSLVHDDLPAMDNDDLRRGKPSCHKAFSEATAILVGDALQSLAFELLTQATQQYSETQQLAMIKLLSTAIGSYGMAGGQMLDIEAENKVLDFAAIDTIHRMKTATLIRASVMMAATVAGASAEVQCKLSDFADTIGLAFQIKDDWLDQTGSSKQLGKTAGKDKIQGKSNYDIAEAEQRTAVLLQKAIEPLSAITGNKQNLQLLAEYIIARKN